MMRRGITAALLAIALTALAATPAPAATKTSASARQKAPPAISGRGLETIVQDDGLLLYRPEAEVQAAVARMKQLGIDRVRITASWSSLTRLPESDIKPPNFEAGDPARCDTFGVQQI